MGQYFISCVLFNYITIRAMHYNMTGNVKVQLYLGVIMRTPRRRIGNGGVASRIPNDHDRLCEQSA